MLNFLFFFNLESLGLIMMMNWMRYLNYCEEEHLSSMKLSLINFWLIFLVYLLFMLMMTMEFSMKMSLSMLFYLLVYLMGVSDLVVFFLLYEMVFIFIMFVILLLGYSYERLMAGFLMMFYSFIFSSPVLMMILLLEHSFLMKEWLLYSSLLNYFFMGSFMVKFPIFGFHYWLPVAHVEASTLGSMLLAGILLKMGTLGMFYMLVYMKFMVKFHWLIFGVLVVMLMILNLSDMKMMIAYSSVAHMTMVFYIMNLGNNVGVVGSVIMMFYHGFISPLMFWLVGLLGWWKTRSLMVVKMMSFSFIFIMFVFVLIIMNMGFPPFMGFLSEILMLKSLVCYKWLLSFMVLSVLFSCYYNVYLFWVFNGVSGMVFKISLVSVDVWVFIMMVFFLNFYLKK